MRGREISEKILKALRKINKPKLIEVVLEGLVVTFLFGLLLNFWAIPALTPTTNIQVSIERPAGQNSLILSFYNSAKYAGQDFRIYLYGITFEQESYLLHTEDLCKLSLLAAGQDKTIVGATATCDYIPPISKISFELINPTITKDNFRVTYWSQNTEVTMQECSSVSLSCKRIN